MGNAVEHVGAIIFAYKNKLVRSLWKINKQILSVRMLDIKHYDFTSLCQLLTSLWLLLTGHFFGSRLGLCNPNFDMCGTI